MCWTDRHRCTCCHIPSSWLEPQSTVSIFWLLLSISECLSSQLFFLGWLEVCGNSPICVSAFSVVITNSTSVSPWLLFDYFNVFMRFSNIMLNVLCSFLVGLQLMENLAKLSCNTIVIQGGVTIFSITLWKLDCSASLANVSHISRLFCMTTYSFTSCAVMYVCFTWFLYCHVCILVIITVSSGA